MAELQTDINVKIKLGDEKNSSGESNLPAIDKGSIVITKDTNRIYIDTTDDVPERIEIGENKQDKFANVTNPGICKVTMSNSGQTYFCNNSSDSGIYFDSSIRLLQGKGIKNNDDLVNKQYVDESLQGKEDSITYKTHLTVGSITTDPDGGGRNTSKLESTSLSFSDKIASATLPSMLITPTAHNGTTPAYLTFASPAQNRAVGNANVRLTGIAAPTADNDAVNRGYLTTKYGSTYYESQDKEFYIPSGSKMVIPNGEMGRLFIGRESGTSTDFKIYVNDPLDDSKLIITNLKTPTNNEDAANKAYVDSKAIPEIFEFQGTPTSNPSIKFNHETSNSTPGGFRLIGPSGMGISFDGYYENNMLGYYISSYGPNPLLLAANIKKSPNATVTDDNDITNKAYVDTQVATKQAKFAEYISTRPSEEAPASASTNILVLNEGTEFYLRDRATNPLVEFKINNAGALQGTTNNLSLTAKNTFNLKSNIFTLSNDKGTPFQIVMDNSSKKVVYCGLSGGDDNGSLYLTDTSRTAQQGATLQGNVSSDARTTALVVNAYNTKLLSWKQGTTTNNAPLLGVSTPVKAADTSKGITANDLDYQAVNKKYVDDIKTELLNAITHPYTYDETTKELTLIL